MNNIFFFHIGKQEYVYEAVRQIKHYNPDSTIYFVGKDIDERIYEYVNFYPYEELLCKQSYNFLEKFQNYSTNNSDFEKICLLRWFCIRNLCIQESLKKIFYADCDIMLYCCLKEEEKKFEKYIFSIAAKTSGHTIFINDTNALEDFCSIVEAFYCNPFGDVILSVKKFDIELFKKQKIKDYHLLKESNKTGGINDMTFWGKLKEIYYAGSVGEVCDIIENSTFDHTISECDGYEMKEGIKNLKNIDGVYYCYNEYLKKYVKFNSIHFQGYNMKNLMWRFRTYG